jgi:protein FAM32A
MSFVGGKLKLKGVTLGADKSKKRKRKEDGSTETTPAPTGGEEKAKALEASKAKSESDKATLAKPEVIPEEYLTEAEIRYRQKKAEIDSRAIKKITQLSHRERLEHFNQRLASTTEHNDIPRISAAGNG